MIRSLLARGASVAVAPPHRLPDYPHARPRPADAALSPQAGQLTEQIRQMLDVTTAQLAQASQALAQAGTDRDAARACQADMQAQMTTMMAQHASTQARLDAAIDRIVQIEGQDDSLDLIKQMEADIKGAVANALASLPKPVKMPIYDMIVTARDGNNRAAKVRLQPAEEQA